MLTGAALQSLTMLVASAGNLFLFVSVPGGWDRAWTRNFKFVYDLNIGKVLKKSQDSRWSETFQQPNWERFPLPVYV